MQRPLALTFGEAAGIGPDITLATWFARSRLGVPPFYLVADPGAIARRAEAVECLFAIAGAVWFWFEAREESDRCGVARE